MKKAGKTPDLARMELLKILASLDEGVLLLTRRGGIAWANSAALQMHGADSLVQLGKTFSGYIRRYSLDYLNRRPVPREQHPIARASGGKEFSGLMVRLHHARNDIHRVLSLRSLMLRDAQGLVDCAALIATDITEQIDAEQRFEQAFQANPAPAVICRLSDLRYTRANQGFLEMSGYSKSGVVGKTVYELDVLAQGSNRQLALERLDQGKTIPQMESVLPLPHGGQKHVIVAGQPIAQGDEDYMLFTFIDLDPSKHVEENLRQTEERFKAAFQLAPVPMVLSNLNDDRIIEVNEAFLATTRYTADETLSATMQSFPLWTPAERYDQLQALLAEGGSARNFELRLNTRDGLILDCMVSAETVIIRGEHCVLSAIQDITDRKHSEGELIAAIELVMQDTSWFSRSIIEKLAQIRRPATQHGSMAELSDLTAREREILGLLCEGRDNADIGNTLGLSRNTIRNHIASIYSKLDVHNRSAAIIWGRERGIIGYQKTSSRQ